MAFVAECMFCHLILRGVPNDRLGSSLECPRCRNCFTLAPTTNPLAETLRTAPQPPKFISMPPRTPLPREKALESITAPLVEDHAPPRPPPPYLSLASFVLGCFAFFTAAILHISCLTFALGLAGLTLGIVVFVLSPVKKGRVLLPASGLVVSLAAVFIVVALPGWLGLSPLWEEPKPPDHSGPAVLSLSGKEVFRRPAEGETLRVDASRDALHQSDVRLRVRSAVVGLVSFELIPGKNPPRERCLIIGLRITNAGIIRKLRYNGWGRGDGEEEDPVVTDDQGKTYRTKTFPLGWVIKGRARAASIPPGKFLDDVVVFEAAPESVHSLMLELPGAPVGVEGPLKVEIPKHMIAFR